MAKFIKNGKCELFHDNSAKIETQSTGIGVTGNIVVSGTVDGVTIAPGEYLATVINANSFTITPVAGTGASISGTASSGSTSGGGNNYDAS